LGFDTEWYQFVLFDTSAQHDSPYGSSIGRHGKIPHGKTMLGQLSDKKEVVSIADDATSMNFDEAIDRRINETQQHKFSCASTNFEAYA
jgi:hypothetical protein